MAARELQLPIVSCENTHRCLHCGGPIPLRAERRGRRRSYCSELCKSHGVRPRSPATCSLCKPRFDDGRNHSARHQRAAATRWARARAETDAAAAEAFCDRCGVTFRYIPGCTPDVPHYCSFACNQRDRVAPRCAVKFVSCETCNQLFCARGEKGGVDLRRSINRWCAECYESRPHGVTRYGQGCRCVTCRAAVAKEARVYTAARKEQGRPLSQTPSARAGKAKYRARKRGAQQTEFVSLGYLLKRDGYRCHLCRKKIDPELRWPHRKCATIDHIRPLSMDGTHEPWNCAPAHLSCNSRKAGKPLGEPLLPMDIPLFGGSL